MGRLCERPGCSEIAAMSYGFDADRLLVWIAARDPAAAPLGAGALCLRHADAMVVPQGWTLDDRRESAPRLFRPASRGERPGGGRASRARRPVSAARAPSPSPLPLAETATGTGTAPGAATDETRETTVAAVAGPNEALDPDATVAFPWRPDFDEHDDLDGVLGATSPLLARAFRGADRPR